MNSKAQEDIKLNRQKLAEKFAQAQTGGNTARRKHKNVAKIQINDDKKLKQIIKKYKLQPFPGVEEVNFFKDDNTIMHFSMPEVHAEFQSNSFAVFGKPETKTLKELMPEIIQHLGPKQFGQLKDLLGPIGKDQAQKIERIQEADEEDDVPDLVGTGQNFEEASKK